MRGLYCCITIGGLEGVCLKIRAFIHCIQASGSGTGKRFLERPDTKYIRLAGNRVSVIRFNSNDVAVKTIHKQAWLCSKKQKLFTKAGSWSIVLAYSLLTSFLGFTSRNQDLQGLEDDVKWCHEVAFSQIQNVGNSTKQMTCFLQQIYDLKTKEEEFLYSKKYPWNVLIKFNMWSFNLKKLDYQEKIKERLGITWPWRTEKNLSDRTMVLRLCSIHI